LAVQLPPIPRRISTRIARTADGIVANHANTNTPSPTPANKPADRAFTPNKNVFINPPSDHAMSSPTRIPGTVSFAESNITAAPN